MQAKNKEEIAKNVQMQPYSSLYVFHERKKKKQKENCLAQGRQSDFEIIPRASH